MHILFTTTVDSSYSAIFTTWLSILLYSLSQSALNDPTGVGSYQYSLAVGCMPSAHKLMDGLPADKKISLLSAGLNCTHLNRVPGFENEGKKHLTKFFVSYPNVRRALMLKAFAATNLYDMIVYADLDAFIVRSPIPDLMTFRMNNFSAVFSRENYNTSFICNGFYAINDMTLPAHLIASSVYGQNDINAWIQSEKLEEPPKIPSYWDHPVNRVYREYLNFTELAIVSSKEIFRMSYTLKHPKKGSTYTVGLLPEPDYFRGGCGSLMTNTRKVEHCQSKFFSGKSKIEIFSKLGRLVSSVDDLEQDMAARVLAKAIAPSCINGSRPIQADNFVYYMKDQKRLSKGYEYTVSCILVDKCFELR